MLQEDGRISYATLGRRLNIPLSTVHDKVRRLTEDGVIKSVAAILDEKAVGFNSTVVMGVETGAKHYVSVADVLRGFDEVVEVYGTTAEFDLMVKIQAKNREEMREIINRIRSLDGVDDIYVFSVLEVFKDVPMRPVAKNKSVKRLG